MFVCALYDSMECRPKSDDASVQILRYALVRKCTLTQYLQLRTVEGSTVQLQHTFTELFPRFCCWILIWLSRHWAWLCRGYWRYRSLIDWLIVYEICCESGWLDRQCDAISTPWYVACEAARLKWQDLLWPLYLLELGTGDQFKRTLKQIVQLQTWWTFTFTLSL